MAPFGHVKLSEEIAGRKTTKRRWWRRSDTSAITVIACGNDEYLAKGYPIGSGIAERHVPHLVKDRMDGTGMQLAFAGSERPCSRPEQLT